MSKRTVNAMDCPECAKSGGSLGSQVLHLNETTGLYGCAQGHAWSMEELALALEGAAASGSEKGHDLAPGKPAKKTVKKAPKKKGKKAAKNAGVKAIAKARPKVALTTDLTRVEEAVLSQDQENGENVLSQNREEAPPRKPTEAEERLMPALSQIEHDLPNGDALVTVAVRELYKEPSRELASQENKTLTEFVQEILDYRFEEIYASMPK